MKMQFKIILLIVSVLIFTNLQAQENLDTLLKIAARNNPELKASFNKYQAALQKVPQAGSLPDLDASFGIFVKPMELISGNQIAQVQIMQMFPWFGTLKAAKDEASAMALSAFELANVQKQELFYSVKTDYYQLYLIQHQVKVYDSTLVLLKSLEQLLLTKLKTINTGNTSQGNKEQLKSQDNSQMGMNKGNQKTEMSESNKMQEQSMTVSNSSFSDLIRLQVEIKELNDKIATLNNRKLLLIIQINTLLNRSANIEITTPDSLKIPEYDFSNPALFDSIKANYPMLKMNKADILAYQKRQIMNKKMGYPMIGIGLNYSLINKNEMSTSEMNGKDMIMPMINLKIPIYRKKYNAMVKEAEILEKAATDELQNSENMLFMEFSEYQITLKDAQRNLSLYNDIIILTKKNLNLLLIQYSSSGAEFNSIILTHRQLLDYKLNIIETQVKQLTAIAGIQKLANNQ
jgi:outer membrane protein TolC